MKFTKLLTFAAMLSLAVACSKSEPPALPTDPDDTEQGGGTGGDTPGGNPGGETPGDDSPAETVPPISPYDGERADDADRDTVGDDEDIYWELNGFEPTVEVVFDGASVTVTTANDAVTSHIEGAHAAVDFTGVKNVGIRVTGSSDDGSLKIYGDKKFMLTLDNLTLASRRGPALNSQCKKRVFVHLADGSTNSLADCVEYADDAWYPEGTVADDEDRKGCFFAEGNMIFSGTGALCVEGLQKHAIATDGYFVMRPGVTVAVPGAAKNGLHVKGDKDELKGIDIRGGLFHVVVGSEAGKCMKTDQNVDISGGRLLLKTTGNAYYDADEKDTSSAAGIKCDGDFRMTDGWLQVESSGTGGKGINADGALTVDGGTIYVATSGGKYVYNAALDLESSPKGIKAEGDIEINGGLVDVTVTGRSDGSEGIESKAVLTMNGGEVRAWAYDDAVNAATGIVINGGRLYAYAENNDGIDSNGYLYINGGLVVASGAAAPEEGIDCDVSAYFHITGGTVIGTGGAAIAPSTSATTQRTVVYNGLSPATKGSNLAVVDSEGRALMIYTLPRTWSQGMSLLFSSADFAEGSYTVCTGVEADGESWYGYRAGGSWSGGTQTGTFTTSGMVTTIGSSWGPGGGGPGGNPGGGPGGGGGRPW